MKVWLLAILPLVVSPSASQAQDATDVLAMCGASTGQGYFIFPSFSDWHEDGIKDGRITFKSGGPSGKPNVVHKDALGVTDARAEGAVVVIVPSGSDKRGFAASVIYPSSGVMETYSVLTLADGKRRLLWTSNKAHVGPNGQLSKVAAYTADCD